MRPRIRGFFWIVPTALAVIIIGACRIQSPEVSELQVQRVNRVYSPVKAHLTDGSTVVYPTGLSRFGDNLVGTGFRYALGSTSSRPITQISLDSIIGLEAYQAKANVGASLALTVGGAALGAVAVASALVAVLGSCPTIYADSAGTQLLQAEAFSYAVAPLFEQRDVDRLSLTPTADGRVVLHIRNEALETHYINQLELLQVQHESNEVAIPDGGGHPLAISRNRIATVIQDRSGRDIANLVRHSDGAQFSTVDKRLASVSESDLRDYIDIVFAAPSGADSVALLINMRNSLLNTVLLYDHILGAPGLKSLDFLGKDLDRIANAVDMGRWYATNMGMHVLVMDNGSFREVARLGDTGPIAFHRGAVLVPAIQGRDDSVRVRLSFAADNWRIDEIGVAARWRRPLSHSITIARAITSDSLQNGSARRVLSDPDEDYLITSPGQSLDVEFDVHTNDIQHNTWFAVSQGYYTEWVRGKWIRKASGKPFEPTSASLVSAMNDWRGKQQSMETDFYTHKIPTR